MRFPQLLVGSLLAGVLAHEEPGPQLIPNLLHVSLLKDVEKTWKTLGDVRFDNGRLLVKNGAIWSKQALTGSDKEWTAEFIFRSLGTSADSANDLTNGLALWLTTEMESDTLNFGGPAKYDGFQILLNAGSDIRGIAVYNSDGFSQLVPQTRFLIGDCKFNYLDLMVPFTIRVLYLDAQSIFKVQIDNNLCFRTDQIRIPPGQQYKLGMLASSKSDEEFEVLRLNVWDKLTEDAIDDHGLLENGAKVAYVTAVAETPKEPPSKIMESIQEQQRQMQNSGQDSINQRSTQEIQQILQQQAKQGQVQMQGVLSKLSGLEGNIDELKLLIVRLAAAPGGGSGSSEGASEWAASAEALKILADQFVDFKKDIASYQGQMLDAIRLLNEKLVGEVGEHQYAVDEMSKKVDLLMAHHKEIKYQADQEVPRPASDDLAVVLILFKWVVLPVLVCVAAILFFMFRLRRDFKQHLKLL